MAPSNNPYKDLEIVRPLMQQVVEGLGAEQYQYGPVGTCHHMGFRLNGLSYRISVFENKDGKTTLSAQQKTPEYMEVFTRVANAIKKDCAVSGGGGRFEMSIPRFDGANVDALLGYLSEQEATVETDKVEHNYRIVRLRGRQGDVLTVKYFENKTLQLQGRRAMLATMTLDFLSNVLNYEDAVKAQLETFKVPLELPEVQREVEGRLPNSFARVSDVVKTQLTTAIALSKLNIDLPDYTPVAFPSLRGLEGFLKTELNRSGFNVAVIKNFGEYFEESGLAYKMKPMHAELAGEPAATLFGDCYTILHDHRHALAHLGTSPANTTILPSLILAQQIVTKVVTCIENFCFKLPR